jgi:IS30 family transposase
MLTQGLNFKEIGEMLGKDATTISKEIKRHRVRRPAQAAGKRDDARTYPCIHASSCKKQNVCDYGRCRIPCRKCIHCRLHCDRFTPQRCGIEKAPPFVCNGCEKRFGRRCKEDKYYYVAEHAQKEYRRTLKESREGIDCTRDEIALIEGLVTPLIKKGQPLNHIYAHHKDEIAISKRTFYRYVHDGDIGVKSIDLRRAVRYRPRKRVRVPKPDPVRKIGHTYDCFQAYIQENPSVRVTEMDTVEGRKGGKLLLTMFMRDVSFMLIFLIDSKEMANAVGVIDMVEGLVGTEALADLIPLLLSDNGSEFSDPAKFEANADGVARTKMFYTEPYHTNQKSRIEKDHEFIRYVFPKGTSFDALAPEDATLLANNINSVARKSLGDKSPFDLAIKKGLGPILKKIGMRPIPPDEVNLTRGLIKTLSKV